MGGLQIANCKLNWMRCQKSIVAFGLCLAGSTVVLIWIFLFCNGSDQESILFARRFERFAGRHYGSPTTRPWLDLLASIPCDIFVNRRGGKRRPFMNLVTLPR